MKVLHVFKVYLPRSRGGIEQVIWQIAESTHRLGVDSTVFTLDPRPEPQPIQVAHHQVVQARQHAYVASTGVTLTGLARFRELAAETDIVHYHFPWPMMDVLHLLGRVTTPSIVTYHSDIVKQQRIMRLYAPLMYAFLDRVDRIVATSPSYASSSPVLARYPDKLRVIPIGLDPAALPVAPPPLIDAWRERLGDGFYLFVGALRYYKGLNYLIEAARKTGLPVVLAGRGTLPDVDLPENVTLLGEVSEDDKVALLTLSRAFVFPSHLRSEAFGVALLEAAFAGVPMISCEIGTGTSYVNAHGETGLVVAPADSDALAGAMMVLAEDEQMRQRFGAAARDRAHRLFSAASAASDYVDLYHEVLARPGRG